MNVSLLSSSECLKVCFEQIRDNYWYGAYGDFRVVMMKDNGWVNVTKMCKDGGKRFDNWIRLDGSKELVATLERLLASENSTLSLASTCDQAVAHIRRCRGNTRLCRLRGQDAEIRHALGAVSGLSVPDRDGGTARRFGRWWTATSFGRAAPVAVAFCEMRLAEEPFAVRKYVGLAFGTEAIWSVRASPSPGIFRADQLAQTSLFCGL